MADGCWLLVDRLESSLHRPRYRFCPTSEVAKCRPLALERAITVQPQHHKEIVMGRGILLWMLGVPIPVILLLAMCSHH
jgi:hypothetical protein